MTWTKETPQRICGLPKDHITLDEYQNEYDNMVVDEEEFEEVQITIGSDIAIILSTED